VQRLSVEPRRKLFNYFSTTSTLLTLLPVLTVRTFHTFQDFSKGCFQLGRGREEQTNNAVASSMAPGFLRSRMSTSSFAMMFPGAAARSPKTFDNCHVEVSRIALYARNTTNNICLTTFARVSDYNFLDTKSRNHVTPSELSKQRGSFQVKLVTFLCTEEGQNEL
jgi:hypothetical protein